MSSVNHFRRIYEAAQTKNKRFSTVYQSILVFITLTDISIQAGNPQNQEFRKQCDVFNNFTVFIQFLQICYQLGLHLSS
ncbi:hypothetical protein CHUAL_011319 [Chamberlinius hualienensis]